MNKQDIKALFLAHGFKEKVLPDGSTDLDPRLYAAARAVIARITDILAHPAGVVRITVPGRSWTHTATLFRDNAANCELPVYVMRGGRW